MKALASVLDILDARLNAHSSAPLVVGFSGGSDSTALLLWARDWSGRTGRPLLSLTVDHGLHPDSATWTATAGATARRLGVPWRALHWRGVKPVTGLPAAARAARHALLADATRETGACVLLLGHTADDVAESGLIRHETPGHGWLREWSPSPAWPQGRGVFLLRPLLAFRRQELQAWIEAQGSGWMNDPANEDLRFARARVRLRLRTASTGLPVGCGRQQSEPALQNGSVRLKETWGEIEMERTALLGAPDAVGLLGRAILCVAGGVRPPARAAIGRALERVTSAETSKTVLAGACIEARGGEVRLFRELGRRPPAPLLLANAGPRVFDGRFEIQGVQGWTAQPLAGLCARLAPKERRALHAVSPRIRGGLPVLLDPRGGVHLPAPLGAGWASFRSLVGGRLRAALGLITDEAGAARQMPTREDHGGGGEAVLSCPAETEVLRQAAAARRSATSSRRARPEGRP